MKSYDFTSTGGAPITQNRLSYLMAAWTETLQALGAIGANQTANTATVMTGMQSSTALGITTVSAGWFVYNSELIRFPVQTYGAPGAGNDVYIVIDRTSTPTPQTYNDGSTPSVINDVTGVLTILPSSTATDATHFLLAAVVPWYTTDPVIAAEVAELISQMNTVLGAWTDDSSSPVISIFSGTGTFGGGTVLVDRFYRPLGSKTITWQLSLRGYTATGSINALLIETPAQFATGGGAWNKPGSKSLQYLSMGGTYAGVTCILSNVGGGVVPCVELIMNPGPFPATGGYDIDLFIVGETT
jgi:hypothetical protein